MIKRKERNNTIDKHNCALDTTNRRKRSSKRDQSHKIARERYEEVKGKRKGGISRRENRIGSLTEFYPCNNFFLFSLSFKRCNSKMQ